MRWTRDGVRITHLLSALILSDGQTQLSCTTNLIHNLWQNIHTYYSYILEVMVAHCGCPPKPARNILLAFDWPCGSLLPKWAPGPRRHPTP